MSRLTLALAQTHEALYPRLERLARQVEAIAARKPESELPETTRATAEMLLYETQRFSRVPGKRLAPGQSKELPPAPETHGALATVLGQALAALDSFETRHSAWSEQHKGFVWRLARGEVKPVGRLKPHAPIIRSVADDKADTALRAELVRRIAAKYDEGFDAGFAQGARSASPAEPSPLSPGDEAG
jgi:hypothetical protein